MGYLWEFAVNQCETAQDGYGYVTKLQQSVGRLTFEHLVDEKQRSADMVTAAQDISHLLRRAGFGGTAAQIAAFSALNIDQVVDQLLNDSAVTQPARPAAVTDTSRDDWERWQTVGNWWFDQIADAPVPSVEKMVLFWMGTITTAYEKVGRIDHLWEIHAIHRRHALGNIRTLVQLSSLTPAMLLYLDNSENRAGSPNQNFARELLELFLLGIGNYTEADVEACARAWSGHNYDWDTHTYRWRPDQHDNGTKTFMGVTRNWNGPEIIDFLFDDPTQRAKIARFYAAKLWSFFAHPNPPDAVVAALADVLLASSFEVKPALRALFLRPEFYLPAAKQGLVRSPIEFFGSIMRASGRRSADLRPMQFCEGLGQQPMNPPNVSGWRPNRYWLSSGAAGQKASWAQDTHWFLDPKNRGMFADLRAMPPGQAVDTAFARIGITEPTAKSRATLVDWLTAQRAAPYEEWFESYGMTVFLFMLPELQVA